MRRPFAGQTSTPIPSGIRPGRLCLAGLLGLMGLALTGCLPQDEPPVATRSVSIPSAWQGVPAKTLFGQPDTPTRGTPEPYGSYAKGCMAGAVELPESGPHWQAMRLSRNRHWGMPELVDYIEDLSDKAADIPGWNGLYVGDMSQPRGGPMTSGHASHQIGLDVDIWLTPTTDMHLSRQDREKISAISLQKDRGAHVNSKWSPAYLQLIRDAAEDPRVARIFLFPGGKVQLCKEATGDRSWLRKVRPWFGHDDHIHVRLHCPEGDTACVEQAAPPEGDGCAEAQTWVDNILNPPPRDPNAKPAPPKPPVTLATLPAQCVSVLQAE